jgi:hypothetical protein
MHEWRQSFEEQSRKDHQELMEQLGNVQTGQHIIQDTVNETKEMMEGVKTMMQQVEFPLTQF